MPPFNPRRWFVIAVNVHTAMDRLYAIHPAMEPEIKNDRRGGRGQPGLNGGGETCCARKFPTAWCMPTIPRRWYLPPLRGRRGTSGVGGEGIKICLRLTRGFCRGGKLWRKIDCLLPCRVASLLPPLSSGGSTVWQDESMIFIVLTLSLSLSLSLFFSRIIDGSTNIMDF